MGIANGERHTLTIEQQLILATLQAVYRRHLHSSLANGDDHREAGRKAREALQTYMATAGGLLCCWESVPHEPAHWLPARQRPNPDVHSTAHSPAM